MFSCIWYHSFSLLHLDREGGGRGGGERQLGTAVENAPISGSRWRDQDRASARGLHEQHVSQRRFPPGGKKKKVAAGGGAIKQHISPNAQLAKQT